MTAFTDALRDWLAADAQGAERAQRAQVLAVDAMGVAAVWPAEASSWPAAARDHFVERLGAADDRALDTEPGSPAWTVAVREARRVAAGIPPHLWRSREPDTIDAALAAFAPLGGLSFIAAEPRTTGGNP